MHLSVLVLNLIVSIASAGWAVAGLVRPAVLSNTATSGSGEVFYARMYAARAIPFGLTAGILPFTSSGAAVAWIVLTAAIIQIADVVIALIKKDRGMAFGASAGAMVHILCGLTIL